MTDLIDYTIFYKKNYESIQEFTKENSHDLFVSVYNDSGRVQKVFEDINANKKHWLILPDYGYKKEEFPLNGEIFDFSNNYSEADIISSYFSKIQKITEINLCIDITGFMRPHLIFLVRYLASQKVKKFDAIFTDPITYVEKEKTTFTKDSVDLVRQIHGCEGSNNADNSNDILLIASGYDFKLISSVAEDKANARKIQIFGLPSLQPDMYQESLIRAYKAEEAIGGKKFLETHSSYFAPANDPFVTASIIQKLINQENKKLPITNLYLSPLSTKAQTLGFALYYVWECIGSPTSIIFPFTNEYTRETTKGISKIWKYTVELPVN